MPETVFVSPCSTGSLATIVWTGVSCFFPPKGISTVAAPIVLSAAGLLYGWDKAMYSLVAYFVISKMIDVVIKGLDESYAVMIVTNEHEEITSALNDRLGRGVTLLHGAGGYTGESKEVLYCVVTRLEVDKLKEIVLEKDESAFVTINVVHDIVGGRFKKKAIH